MGIENATIQPGPDGKAHIVLEKAHIPLKDISTFTFETDDLEAFGTYAAAQEGDRAIFYDHQSLALWPVDKITSKSKPLAVGRLTTSEPLAFLQKHLGKPLDLADFEKMLNTLRRAGTFLTLISKLRSLVISKETKYEREIDNAANFKLLIERKGATGDWVPPATLTFAVPVFAFMDDPITVEADLIMTMRDEDGGAPIFTLEALNLAEDLKKRQREILETRLGKWSTVPKYWGKTYVSAETDAYLYKDVGATL